MWFTLTVQIIELFCRKNWFGSDNIVMNFREHKKKKKLYGMMVVFLEQQVSFSTFICITNSLIQLNWANTNQIVNSLGVG